MHKAVSFSLVTRLNWHIKYSSDNCKVVPTGKADPSFTYKIMSSELTFASQEQGFGAVIENSTKISAQILSSKTTNLMKESIRKELEAR